MKAVIDNNVIIDAIAAREPFNVAAEKIVLAAGEEKFQGYITANSATDIYYVMKKACGAVQAKELLTRLFDVFDVVAVNKKDCQNALMVDMDDFEDALIAVCAKRIDADFIVSRDGDFLKAKSPIPVISAAVFVGKIENDGRQ